jgi:hypothetical protein
MAKKNTAIPDNPSTTPAAPRRRSARKANPVPIDSAADMSTAAVAPSSSVWAPSYEEIAEAAYQRYLSRGGEHGQDWDDWLEAERELRSRK